MTGRDEKLGVEFHCIPFLCYLGGVSGVIYAGGRGSTKRSERTGEKNCGRKKAVRKGASILKRSLRFSKMLLVLGTTFSYASFSSILQSKEL